MDYRPQDFVTILDVNETAIEKFWKSPCVERYDEDMADDSVQCVARTFAEI